MSNSLLLSQSTEPACLKKDYNAIQFKDSNALRKV